MKTIVLLLTLALALLSAIPSSETSRHQDSSEEKQDRYRYRDRERERNRESSLLVNFFNELRKAGRIRDVPDSAQDSQNNVNEQTERYPDQAALPQNFFTPTPVPDVGVRISNTDPGHLIKKVINEQNYSQPPRKRQQFVPTASPPIYEPLPAYVPKAPYDLGNVNRGVSTILGGVGQGRLSDILRGSFMFTRNDRVKSVANSVIDSIFGRREESLPSGEGLFPLRGL